MKSPADLDRVDGLILPGGESTTIGLLLKKSGLDAAIQDHHRRRGLPLFGTCAGLILLAKRIEETPDQPRLGLLDVTVHDGSAPTDPVEGGQDVRVELLGNDRP